MNALIKTEDKGDYVVMLLECNFNGHDESDYLRDSFKKLQQEGKGKVAVNLEKVEYFASMAYRAFISGNALLNKIDGKMAFYNVSEYIRNVMDLTRLTLIFKLFDTKEEALEYLSADEK